MPKHDCCHIWTGVTLDVTWNCLDKLYKNRYAELSVLHLLPLLNPWLIAKI